MLGLCRVCWVFAKYLHIPPNFHPHTIITPRRPLFGWPRASRLAKGLVERVGNGAGESSPRAPGAAWGPGAEAPGILGGLCNLSAAPSASRWHAGSSLRFREPGAGACATPCPSATWVIPRAEACQAGREIYRILPFNRVSTGGHFLRVLGRGPPLPPSKGCGNPAC